MNPGKGKTTILFVNHNQKVIKPIQVSSKLILNWKKYAFAVFLVFSSLITVIVYLASGKIKENKQIMALTQKLHSVHFLSRQVDTNAIREKFSNIDKELVNINSSLKARGIKAVFIEPQGGEADNDPQSIDEMSNFYEGYLKKVKYNITYTPIGYPYPGRITSTFGHRENPFDGSGIETHKGLDIKGPMGAPVKAMARGNVEFAGLRGGFGNCIILKHGNGFETLYGHLSKILVRTGQTIDIGQQIGNIGSTGRSTGPHLHYEVHRYGQKINPESFLTLN
ncbi:MAG: M23 family metallopeptidase [Ginsengibacter sp.]|jgi:murein DD-endopeptidase MepM/ murein hydrolase activator NlpD